MVVYVRSVLSSRTHSPHLTESTTYQWGWCGDRTEGTAARLTRVGGTEIDA
jgi:hypothetical protein